MSRKCPKCGRESYFKDISSHKSECCENNPILQHREELGNLPFYGMQCFSCYHIFIVISSKSRNFAHLTYIGFDNPPIMIYCGKAYFLLGAVKMFGELFPIFYRKGSFVVPFDYNLFFCMPFQNWEGGRPETFFNYFKCSLEDYMIEKEFVRDPSLKRFEYQIRNWL